jgi:hypothetical protein
MGREGVDGVEQGKRTRGKRKHSGLRQALALAERRLAAVEASGS